MVARAALTNRRESTPFPGTIGLAAIASVNPTGECIRALQL